MYTVQSAPIAGDESTIPPVANRHNSAPDVAFTAYTKPSRDPKYTKVASMPAAKRGDLAVSRIVHVALPFVHRAGDDATPPFTA